MLKFRQTELRVKVRQTELMLKFGFEDNPEIDRAIERSRVNGFGYVRQRSLCQALPTNVPEPFRTHR